MHFRKNSTCAFLGGSQLLGDVLLDGFVSCGGLFSRCRPRFAHGGADGGQCGGDYRSDCLPYCDDRVSAILPDELERQGDDLECRTQNLADQHDADLNGVLDGLPRCGGRRRDSLPNTGQEFDRCGEFLSYCGEELGDGGLGVAQKYSGRCHCVPGCCDDLRKRTLDGREYGVHAVAEPLALGVEQNDDGDGCCNGGDDDSDGVCGHRCAQCFLCAGRHGGGLCPSSLCQLGHRDLLREESHEDLIQLESAVKGCLCNVGIFGTHRKQPQLHLRHLKSVDDGLDALSGLERHKDCRRCDQLIPEPGHGVEGGQHLVGEVCRDLNRGQKAIDQSRDERRGPLDALGDQVDGRDRKAAETVEQVLVIHDDRADRCECATDLFECGNAILGECLNLGQGILYKSVSRSSDPIGD